MALVRAALCCVATRARAITGYSIQLRSYTTGGRRARGTTGRIVRGFGFERNCAMSWAGQAARRAAGPKMKRSSNQKTSAVGRRASARLARRRGSRAAAGQSRTRTVRSVVPACGHCPLCGCGVALSRERVRKFMGRSSTAHGHAAGMFAVAGPSTHKDKLHARRHARIAFTT